VNRNQQWIPQVLALAGIVELSTGNYTTAIGHLEESLQLFTTLGIDGGRFMVLSDLGYVLLNQGDIAQARAYFRECLEGDRRTGNELDVASDLVNLGWCALELDEIADAQPAFTAALQTYAARHELIEGSEAIEGLAAVASVSGQHDRAAQLFGAARAIQDSMELIVGPGEAVRWRQLTQARARVDPLVWDHHWYEGQRLSIEDAMLLALRSTS